MPRRKGISNRPCPALSLDIALQVARAIKEQNAGRPMNRLLLAEAMGYSPASSSFRDRIASSAKFQLTEGNYHSEIISMTEIGRGATSPRNEHERVEAMREALRSVPVFNDILDHFANNKLPKAEFLKNTLERDPFNVSPDWSSAVAEQFEEIARFVGYLRDIGGSPHIVIDSSTTAPEIPTDAEATRDLGADGGADLSKKEESARRGSEKDAGETNVPGHRPIPVQLFIAHGKNKKPLEQLKGILNDWKVPYLVAIDEPHAGRPISQKVAQTMQECTAGIFIFTADEQFIDEHREVVARPSGNVVYELGAASLLYGNKIVILKETGVQFPSDFSDLGWIEFEVGALDAKALDLLRELIALDALRLVSAIST